MTSSLLKTKSNRLIEIRNVPVVQAAAYATGDLIGGKQELLYAVEETDGAGVIRGARLISTGAITNQVDLIFFNADPTNTTFTENGAFALDGDDVAKVIGGVEIDTFFAFNANGFGQSGFGELCLPFVLADGTSLFCAMIARGAVTPAAVDGLELRLAIERL